MSNNKVEATLWPETPSGAYIQHNIETLCSIGGIYDLLALEVERDHAEILAAWRLDHPAKSAIELLRESGRKVPTEYTQTKE